MSSSRYPASPSKLFARIAVAGMSLAVVALGGLALVGAIVAQNGADKLSRAGVQTSGHLRAVQALSLIDTSTDELEEEIVPVHLARLRNAQKVLDDALDRMESGGVLEASRIAARSKPIVAQLKPAIEVFIARPPGYDSDGSGGAEEAMENIMGELQVVLNDLDSDPSQLPATELASVSATGRDRSRHRVSAHPARVGRRGGLRMAAERLSPARRGHDARRSRRHCGGGAHRRADRPSEPPCAARSARATDQRKRELHADARRSQWLQALQRHFRPSRRRRSAPTTRPQARRRMRGPRDRGSARWGRVLRPALRRRARARGSRPAARGAQRRRRGISITSASGLVVVPEEAHDPSAALRLADSRMYAAKIKSHRTADEGVAAALIRMLDERHPGLGRNLEEVASLAVACAESLGLSADDAQLIQRAAELHDVGKVGIPSEILTKQGPLSDEEFEFMRRHSVIGERILAGVPSLERAAALVRSSHERWDGAGYPDGLARDAILIGARIVFVADAYCAMTEGRPYASARTAESARKELRACSGAQFDPTVVTTFLEVLDSRALAQTLNQREWPRSSRPAPSPA